DLASFLCPQYSFTAQSIRSGTIPLWNPNLYAGAPFLADNQAGVLYPINLLAFWLLPNFSYQVMEGLVVLHIWIAGVAMFCCLRLWPSLSHDNGARVGLGRGAALIGAIAFMFSDVYVTHIGNLNLIAAAAWLPLAFGLFAHGLYRRQAGKVIGSGIIFGLALLAGHAQMSIITLLGLGLIALWQIFIAATWRDRSRIFGLSLLMLVVAFGLTAVQLLPSIEMTRYSLRSGLTLDEATAFSLPPTALASIFSPWLFGRGAIDFWGPWQRVETGYLGVVPLLLMLFAFKRKLSSWIWLFVAMGLVGLLLALGKFTPIYSLFHTLPIFNGLRVPARFVLLTDFSIAALAAIGFERLRAGEFELRSVWWRCGILLIAGIAALFVAYQSLGNAEHISNLVGATFSFSLITLVVSALIMWRTKSALRTLPFAMLLIGLASFELIAFGSTIEIDANDPTLNFKHPQVVEFLHSDPNLYRIDNTSNVWQPDAALVNGLDDIGGIFNPLSLANYETYRGGMGNRGSALYNFLGVKYVLAPKGDPPGDTSFVLVFNADPAIDVYLNTRALPRVQLLDRAIVVASGEDAWQAIHQPDFDPSKEVVIQGGEQLPGGADQLRVRSIAFGKISNDRVEINFETSSPAYLVISTVYYPGWVATLDDRATEIYPADFAFQAINVPPGSHRVVLQFDPLSLKIGLIVSGVTLLVLVFLGLKAYFRPNTPRAMTRR
ncbi:MAG TPA: YfhO family protein, partial [Anaerolineae bacterium]|nr:YfhO family protein [Anaerolineae bacterium]